MSQSLTVFIQHFWFPGLPPWHRKIWTLLAILSFTMIIYNLATPTPAPQKPFPSKQGQVIVKGTFGRIRVYWYEIKKGCSFDIFHEHRDIRPLMQDNWYDARMPLSKKLDGACTFESISNAIDKFMQEFNPSDRVSWETIRDALKEQLTLLFTP